MRLIRQIKNFTALAVALIVLTTSCCFAQETTAETVSYIKELLSIDDSYTVFHASSHERGRLFREFSWSRENANVYVVCDDDGCVYQYSRYTRTDTAADEELRYPLQDAEGFCAAAQEFTDTLMTGKESCHFAPEDMDRTVIGQTTRYLTAQLMINGIPTDTLVSVVLGAEADGSVRVLSYSRSDSLADYSAEIAEQNVISRDEALTAFQGRTDVKMVYRKTDEGTAIPVYERFDSPGLIDAVTGEELERSAAVMYECADAEEEGLAYVMSGKGRELTEVELEGTQKYDDAMDRAEADAFARGISALGLDGMELTGYSLMRDDGGIKGSMTYTSGDDMYTKYISIDAERGTLLTVSGYDKDQDGEACVDRDQATQKAQSFISAVLGDRASFCRCEEMVLPETEGNDPCRYIFRYARYENGIPYTDTALLYINAVNGYVDHWSFDWDEDAVFEPIAPVITQDEAKATFADDTDCRLVYADTARDEWMYRTLAWQESERKISRVEVNTGRTVYAESGKATDIVTGGPAEVQACAERLAAYGICYARDERDPDKPLTVREALRLALTLRGCTWIPEAEDEELIDMIGIYAGLRDVPGMDEEVTLYRFTDLIVRCAGYARAAQLKGIFDAGFTDEVPPGEEGTLSIGFALGLVAKDANGGSGRERVLTRADALVMLDRMLSRRD